MEINFAGGRYYIKSNFEKHPFGDKQAIIIYDGAAIFLSSVGPRMRPKGAEGHIYAAGHPLIAPAIADFPYNPARLPESVVFLQPLLDAGTKLEFQRLEGGDYLCAYDNGEVAGDFRIAKAQGYNVVAARTLMPGTKKALDVCDADWGKADGVWFVKRLIEKEFGSSGEERRTIFEYEKFVPNAKIGAERFGFGALELAPGVRVLDHRKGHQKVYRDFRQQGRQRATG
jgi:hypothetical protein